MLSDPRGVWILLNVGRIFALVNAVKLRFCFVHAAVAVYGLLIFGGCACAVIGARIEV